MLLTDQDIQEFIAVYEQEFNEHLPFEDARAKASQLLFLVEQLLSPLPSETTALIDSEERLKVRGMSLPHS